MKRNIQTYIRHILSVEILGIMLSFTACQKTPETDYVTNKEGQANLISNHAGYDAGIPLNEQCNAPTHVQISGETKNDYTIIEVNADVYIPEQTAVPIYTVEQKDITEDHIADMVKTVFPTEEYYNPQYNRRSLNMTKDEIYAQIEKNERWINNAEVTDVEEPVFDDETGELLEANEEYFNHLQEAVEYYLTELTIAENEPDYGEGVSYEYQPQTEEMYVSSDQTIDYEYETAYFRGKTGNTPTQEAYLLIARDGFNEEIHYNLCSVLQCGYASNEIDLLGKISSDYERNSCSYSKTEATDMAEAFISSLGFENMKVQYLEDVELITYDDNGNGYYNSVSHGRSGYRLYLYRTYGDLGDTYLSMNDSNIICSYQGGVYGIYSALPDMAWNYVWNGDNQDAGMENALKVPAYREIAVVTILDDGIVDAYIINPQEEKEQLAENVVLLDFEQVLNQALTQFEILYGDKGKQGEMVRIKIHRIEMNYAYMQAPNNEKEGTLIPVWDFKDSQSGSTCVTINAIDGTVFDREKGH